jgi:CheY-like chemotaxis protein
VATDSGTRDPLRVLIYSSNRNTRADVISALGPRPSMELPLVEYTEVATEPGFISAADKGKFDLFILDGEATPAGGMGLARQIKDELYRCPPVLVLIARPQDAWLATWSRADAVVGLPIEPVSTAQAVSRLLATRLSLTS